MVLVFVSGLGSALGLHLLAFVANRIDDHNDTVANSTDDAETKKANYLEPSYFAAARISYPILAVRPIELVLAPRSVCMCLLDADASLDRSLSTWQSSPSALASRART